MKAAEADLIAAEAEVKLTIVEHDRPGRVAKDRGAASLLGLRQDPVGPGRGRRSSVTGRSKALALARNRLSYCTLAADADGVVTALAGRGGSGGGRRAAGRPSRPGRGAEAVVSLPENRVVRRSVGPGQGHPLVDPGRRSSPPNFASCRRPPTRSRAPTRPGSRSPAPAPEVGLGMTATVHLTAADAAPGFMLPLSSLLRKGGRPAVWVVGRERRAADARRRSRCGSTGRSRS